MACCVSSSLSCNPPGSEVGRGLRKDAWRDPRFPAIPARRSPCSATPSAPGLRRLFPRDQRPRKSGPGPSIAAGEHVLLVSPTGTGKTLAAFLAILDRLFRAHEAGTLAPGLRCVYVSPLRSLNYDIERNLNVPLEGIRQQTRLRALPGASRRSDRGHFGLSAPQAARTAAARVDHDSGEPVALVESTELAGALARRRAHHRR